MWKIYLYVKLLFFSCQLFLLCQCYQIVMPNYVHKTMPEKWYPHRGGSRGGSLGSGDPPLHNTLGKQKEWCVVIKTHKNVPFLELNAILAVLKERIQFFLKGCTHHTPYTVLVKTTSIKKSSLYVNIENKPFRSNFHASKMQHPIASGGHSPPDPLLQRSTSVFRPPLQKILDPPL